MRRTALILLLFAALAGALIPAGTAVAGDDADGSDPGGSPKLKSGDLVVSDVAAFGGGGGLIRVIVSNGRRNTISENANPPGFPEFVNPRYVAVERDGDLVVAGSFTLGGGVTAVGVIRVDPDTGVRRTVSLTSSAGNFPVGGPSFVSPNGIAVEPGGTILVTDRGFDGLIRIDPATGARTVLSSSTVPIGGAGGLQFTAPNDVAFDAAGQLFVSDEQGLPNANGRGVIFRVDTTTGWRFPLSSDFVGPAGSWLSVPQGIDVDKKSQILVANPNFGPEGQGVLSISPATGDRSTITNLTTQPGPPSFTVPEDVAHDPAGGSIFAIDNRGATNNDRGVLRVRRRGGTRTIVSYNASPVDTPNFDFPFGVAVYPITFTKAFRPASSIILKGGTTFTFGLSERARAAITIARRTAGRIDKARGCRPATSANRKGLACAIFTPVGTLTASVGKGTARMPFSGRFKGKALTPGAYRATLVATNAAGNQTVPASVDLTVRGG